MTPAEFVDPAAEGSPDQPAPPPGADAPEALLSELDEGLHRLAVTAETLARRLSHREARLDRTQRSALETCRDNARAIVGSLDRVL